MKTVPDSSLTRQEFLKLAAGLFSGLGISSAAETDPASKALDPAYLERGLTAMARAQTWFDAHWGAGILAGYYLCRDHPLSAETVSGIRRQMDTVIEVRAEQFQPMPDGGAENQRIDDIPKALLPAMKGGLRAHGHAVIFASLSTRALRDAPHMARPGIIDALCGLSRQIAKLKPERPMPATEGYSSTQAMIDTTFESLARFQPLLGHAEVRRPNFTHMITHTEALMNLEHMGFGDLARAGHPGHRVHISAPVPEVPNSTAEARRATMEKVMSGAFWSDTANTGLWKEKWNQTTNPNGDWIASGHLFKVLYSHHRLLSRVQDAERARLCTAILLERYINPAVQGG
jgi:hypothetical protein